MCPNNIPELSPLIVQRAHEMLGVHEPVGLQQGRLVTNMESPPQTRQFMRPSGAKHFSNSC